MKLRNRQHYMNTLSEGAPDRSIRPRITQAIYIVIVLSVVIYLTYVISHRFFYFHEVGFVEVEKTSLSSQRGGNLRSIFTTRGEEVKKGKRLALVAANRQCPNASDAPVQKIEHELELKQAEKEILSQQYERSLAHSKETVLHRALALEGGLYEDRQKQQLENQRQQAKILLLEREITVLKGQANALRQTVSSQVVPMDCINEPILAPFDGIVVSIRRSENEYVSKGEAFITIQPKSANVYVEAYLDNDRFHNVPIGKEVSIQFPDGNRDSGKIKHVQSSATPVAYREWHNYQPAQPQVLVQIVPHNKAALSHWRRFDRMQVQVRGRK